MSNNSSGMILEKMATFLCVSFFCWGCQPNQLSQANYVAWVQEPSHGLKQRVQVGTRVLQVQYEPAEYVLLKRYRGQLPDKAEYASELTKLKGTHFFSLTIQEASSTVSSSPSQAKEAANWYHYYSFAFQRDIQMEEGSRKEPCTFYFFTAGHGTSKAEFELGFSSSEEEGDNTLLIEPNPFGGAPVRIKISKEDLRTIPHLKLG